MELSELRVGKVVKACDRIKNSQGGGLHAIIVKESEKQPRYKDRGEDFRQFRLKFIEGRVDCVVVGFEYDYLAKNFQEPSTQSLVTEYELVEEDENTPFRTGDRVKGASSYIGQGEGVVLGRPASEVNDKDEIVYRVCFDNENNNHSVDFVTGKGYARFHPKFLEKIVKDEPKKPEKPSTKFKVGDIVRVDYKTHELSGKDLTVTQVHPTVRTCVVTDKEGKKGNEAHFFWNHLEKVEPKKPEKPSPKYKVGETVRIDLAHHELHGNDIVVNRVVEASIKREKFIYYVDGRTDVAFYEKYLEKVEPKEPEKPSPKYQVGDIVRTTYKHHEFAGKDIMVRSCPTPEVSVAGPNDSNTIDYFFNKNLEKVEPTKKPSNQAIKRWQLLENERMRCEFEGKPFVYPGSLKLARKEAGIPT